MEILIRNGQKQIVTLKRAVTVFSTFSENPDTKCTKANRNVANAPRMLCVFFATRRLRSCLCCFTCYTLAIRRVQGWIKGATFRPVEEKVRARVSSGMDSRVDVRPADRLLGKEAWRMQRQQECDRGHITEPMLLHSVGLHVGKAGLSATVRPRPKQDPPGPPVCRWKSASIIFPTVIN